MEEFVKEVLYAFPLLETVEKDYEDHIRNKAVLSYKSNLTAEQLAEYLVGEILEKQRFVWLKERVRAVLDKLDALERTMVEVRYFGKKRKEKLPKDTPFGKWSERKYFREQERLGKKLAGLVIAAGITEEVFTDWFLPTELFGQVCTYTKKYTKGVSLREKKWLLEV